MRARKLWTWALTACTWIAGGASADLIGLDPACPQFKHDQPGVLTFEAGTGSLTIVADLKTIQFEHDGPLQSVEPTGDPGERYIIINAVVDGEGELIAGVEGDDLVVVGQIDEDGDGSPDYMGVLLTGEIELFGHEDGRVGASEEPRAQSMLPYHVGVDNYDFLFTPTGGALAPIYGDQGVGATVRSTQSNFHGSFAEDFGGTAAGALGALGDTGACCFPDGSCEEGLTREECQAAGGSYVGNGVPCQPGTCRIPKGACCLPDGNCDFRARERCEAVGGAFQGVGTICDDTICDPGACCLPDGSCVDDITRGECDDRGGEFFPGRTCDDGVCDDTGACCFDNGNCADDLTQDECIANGGIYQGDGTNCANVNCPPTKGACCFPNGACGIMTQDECRDQGGLYQGDETHCEPDRCPPPKGACCFPDGTCGVKTQDQCRDEGGLYQGMETICEPGRCPQPDGACCLPDGNCTITTQDDCNDRGGNYQGDDTECAPGLCRDPEGACCFDDGDCIDGLTAAECNAAGGDYQGDDTTCGDVECPGPGACCFDNGDCLEGQTLEECENAGGTFQGTGVPCEPGTCPPPKGACCLPDGSCEQQPEERCLENGGDYRGDMTDCEDVDCTGACCLMDGTCVDDVTEEQCNAQDGDYQGDGSECADVDCGGACCLPDTNCSTGDFDCDGKVVQMTMIWDGDQPVRIKAYDGNVGDDLLADIDDIQPGDEVTVGPLDGPNDSYWEVFEAGTDNLIGLSKFHRSCSDNEMNGPEDCGNREGNGKGNENDLINDWLLEGLVDERGNVLDCTSEPGNCVILSAEQCAAEGGVFQGGGTSCEDVECVDPTGECCLDNDCQDLSRFCCEAAGGVYSGDGTNCQDDPCFDCDGKVVEMTMIWDGGQPVRIKAYDGNVGDDLLADIDNIQVGDEVTVGPLAGPNDSYWEVFEAGTDNLIGESKFHRSCSDNEMNGAEDCGNRQGNGKGNDDGLINDWILEGLVDERGAVLDCSAGGGASINITRRVSSDLDDAEERFSDGYCYVDSSDLELAYDGGTPTDVVGIRFVDLDVPQGAVIDQAWIQFTTDEKTDQAVALMIHGQAADSAAPFAEAPYDISTRLATSASVAWSPAKWDPEGSSGPAQRTPDLTSIVQEIVDRPGWSSGGAMVFVVGGEGTRTAESYGGDPNAAPRLRITYTAVGAQRAPREVVAADINRDGIVDTLDLLELMKKWGTCESCPEDLNGDRVVDMRDLIILTERF